jgi:hypothetical protein
MLLALCLMTSSLLRVQADHSRRERDRSELADAEERSDSRRSQEAEKEREMDEKEEETTESLLLVGFSL